MAVAKARTIRPAFGEESARFGGDAPMFVVLQSIDHQNADKLAHRIGRPARAELKFAHRKRKRVFDWNGEPKPFFVVLHLSYSRRR